MLTYFILDGIRHHTYEAAFPLLPEGEQRHDGAGLRPDRRGQPARPHEGLDGRGLVVGDPRFHEGCEAERRQGHAVCRGSQGG